MRRGLIFAAEMLATLAIGYFAFVWTAWLLLAVPVVIAATIGALMLTAEKPAAREGRVVDRDLY